MSQGKAHVKYFLKSEEGRATVQRAKELEGGVEILDVEQETEEQKLQKRLSSWRSNGEAAMAVTAAGVAA